MFLSSRRALGSLLLMGASVLSCGGATIQTSPVALTPKQAVEGAVYFLPKTLLLVKLNVAVTPATKSTCGDGVALANACDLQADRLVLRDLTIETLSVPDTSSAFAIQTSGSFVVKTEFTASFNDRGELTSSTSSSANQAIQFATTGFEALAKVVGAAAMAGQSSSEREALAKQARRLEAAIAEIDKKIDASWPLFNTSTAGSAPAKPTTKAAPIKPAEIVDEVTHLLELRAKLTALLTEVSSKLAQPEIVLPVACLVDPTGASPINLQSSCDAYKEVPGALTSAGITLNVGLPTLDLKLTYQAGPVAPSVAAPAKSRSGFFYRIPAWFEAEVVAGSGARTRMTVAVPQRGQVALWEIGDKDLRSGKTISIELQPGLGSVKSVTLNGDPVATADLAALVTAAKGITTAPEDAEVDALKRQTAKLDAQRALLEAKQKLEEAKKPKKDEETD